MCLWFLFHCSAVFHWSNNHNLLNIPGWGTWVVSSLWLCMFLYVSFERKCHHFSKCLALCLFNVSEALWRNCSAPEFSLSSTS